MKKRLFKFIVIASIGLLTLAIFSFAEFKNTVSTNSTTSVDLGTSEWFLDEELYSSIGFYFDMELNDRGTDVTSTGAWDPTHLLTSEENVVQRYVASTGTIITRGYQFFKLTESLYWFSANDAEIDDIFFVNGTFSDSNGYHINIKPIYVKVVDKNASGIKVKCDTPIITPSIYSSGEVDNDVIKVYDGTSKSALSFQIDKGSCNVTYSSGAIRYLDFVRQENETISQYTATVNVDYNNFSYQLNYKLFVGQLGFEMANGASITYDASSCELRFIATIPHFYSSSFNENNVKFIITKKSDLHDYKLNYDNVFGTNRKFTFDSSEIGKYLIKKAEHIKCNVDVNDVCTAVGSIKGLTQEDFLTQYVGVCYLERGGSRVFASFENDDQLSNTRSPYQVACLAYDNGDTSLYTKYISPISKSYVNYTIRCFNGDSKNSLISTKSSIGKLFDEINAPTIQGLKSTFASHRISGEGNVLDFYYNKDYGTDFDVFGWDIPLPDTTDNFNNEYVNEIAKNLKNAGISVAILSGHAHIEIHNDSDISYYKYLIKAFYNNGVKTAVQIGGSVDEDKHYYKSTPDFSSCPGFYGYLEWDEPSYSKLPNELATYASKFNKTYKNTNSKFMVNLNPSHAKASIISSSYTQYLQDYCSYVLGNLDVSHRFMSVDNYSFYKVTDKIQENTLYDMALTSLYGHVYNATTSFCLQSCGWDDTITHTDDTHMRAPTEGEMNMSVYNALCFGFDTISWFTYSANSGHYQDKDENGGQIVTAVNKDNTINDTIYNALKSANNSWKNGKELLRGYKYRGTFVKPRNSFSSDAKPFNMILNESTWTMDRGGYYYIPDITTMSNSLFSSVSSTRSYLIGVYENNSGNQTYVINNYITQDNASTTVTIKMNEDVVVRQNGIDQTLKSGTSKSFTINQGSGLIVRKA